MALERDQKKIKHRIKALASIQRNRNKTNASKQSKKILIRFDEFKGEYKNNKEIGNIEAELDIDFSNKMIWILFIQ